MALLFLVLFAFALSSPVAYARIIRPALDRKRHYRTLTNISRLERELGIAVPEPSWSAIGHKRAIEELAFAPGALWLVDDPGDVQVLRVPLAQYGAMCASSVASPYRIVPRQQPVVEAPKLDVPLFVATGVPIVH